MQAPLSQKWQEYFDSIPSYQTHMMRQYALHVETQMPQLEQPCQKRQR